MIAAQIALLLAILLLVSFAFASEFTPGIADGNAAIYARQHA